MGAAYAMEFRRAVAKAYDDCGSSAEVAAMFDCSESWVRRLIQRRRLTDSLCAAAAEAPRHAQAGRRGPGGAAPAEQDRPDVRDRRGRWFTHEFVGRAGEGPAQHRGGDDRAGDRDGRDFDAAVDAGAFLAFVEQ